MYQNEKVENQASFLDSWKTNIVELGTGAALVGGMAYMGMTGRLPDLARSGENALKKVKGSVNAYLDRTLPASVRFLKNVVVNSVDKGVKINRKGTNLNEAIAQHRIEQPDIQIDQRKVQDIAAQMWQKDREKSEALQEYAREIGTLGQQKVPFLKPMSYYIEKAKFDEEQRIRTESVKSRVSNINDNPVNADNQNQTKSWITDALGAGIAGGMFGAGITAFHALDHHLREDSKPNDRNRSYTAAGSKFQQNKNNKNFESRKFQNKNFDRKPHNFNNKEREDMTRFKKEASVFRHIHDQASELGMNTPRAVATGLGYTGVSLATAMMLKNYPELLRGNLNVANSINSSPPDNNNPRIIIELGDNDTFPKTAGFMNYVRNLGGRPTEIAELNKKIQGDIGNYRDDVFASLSRVGGPMKSLEEATKEHYGHHWTPEMHRDLAKEMIESKATALKQQDIAEREAIKDAVAKARVITGSSALGLAGLGYGGYKLMNRETGE